MKTRVVAATKGFQECARDRIDIDMEGSNIGRLKRDVSAPSDDRSPGKASWERQYRRLDSISISELAHWLSSIATFSQTDQYRTVLLFCLRLLYLPGTYRVSHTLVQGVTGGRVGVAPVMAAVSLGIWPIDGF